MSESIEPFVDTLRSLPLFEVLDDHTVRYTWSRPNPFFLPRIAGAYPLFVYRPAHYLKQFHVDFADPEELKQKARKRRMRGWAALHNNSDNLYDLNNPELPTLQPWYNTIRPPAQQFVFLRSLIGIVLFLLLARRFGGMQSLVTRRWGWHVLRTLLASGAMFGFFFGLSRMPLIDALTLGFTAPLMMTALSVPLLGEHVGWRRWLAVVAGFVTARWNRSVAARTSGGPLAS